MNKLIFGMMLAIALTGCSQKDSIQRIMSFYADNPAEEMLEDVIEDQTGVKIDFTGDSEE